jgi:hypothetical protein
MTKLVATLLQLPVLGQDAMHGAYRAEIDVLIQQRGIDLHRSLVPAALFKARFMMRMVVTTWPWALLLMTP